MSQCSFHPWCQMFDVFRSQDGDSRCSAASTCNRFFYYLQIQRELKISPAFSVVMGTGQQGRTAHALLSSLLSLHTYMCKTRHVKPSSQTTKSNNWIKKYVNRTEEKVSTAGQVAVATTDQRKNEIQEDRIDTTSR